MSVIQSIPASQIVKWNPSVIGAGGAGFQLNGLFLTTSYRIPIGTVQSFPNAQSVANFFGANSTEAAMASVYFLGINGSLITPGALLFAQYPWTAPVNAYLQSGSVASMSLAALQALSGTLIITIDGTTFTSGTINLGAATSFSSAAIIIQTGLAAVEASVTAAIAAGTGVIATSSIAGTTLTVGTVSSGFVLPGAVVTGGTTAAGTTIVKQLTGTAGGGAGATFQVSISQTVTSATLTATSTQGVMTVSAVGSGTLAVGQNLAGTNVLAGSNIAALLSGTGGTGTYVVNLTQTVASTTVTAGTATVTYDSQSGSFFINGGTIGAGGTIGFATGTLSVALNMTAATGAVLSQGSALATPATFMTAIANQTQNWFSLVTVFDPVTADKVAFAGWINGQGDSYQYIDGTKDAAAVTVPDTTTALSTIIADGYGGTVGVYDPNITTSGPLISAFVASWAASLAFSSPNGRSTLFARSQTGLTAGVTSATVAANLLTNGYNYYGAYGTANQVFTFFNNGSITGPYLWADSYANSAYIKNALQLAIMQLMTSVGIIPYNSAGDGLIEQACAATINQFGAYGGFAAGVTLSPLQISEVNAQAGQNIATALQTRGWYLLSQAGSTPANIRAQRGSPFIAFFYVDGQSVQIVTGSSVVIL